MSKLYIKGIGIMVGMMFGAGIFALPFSFSQAGLFWGCVHFVIAFCVLLLFHFLYAEVAYFAEGRHRFTGYVEIFLGKIAKRFAFLTTVASYYGALLVYGLLGGLFLSTPLIPFFKHLIGGGFFENLTAFHFSLAFFVVAGLLVLLNLNKIAEINFYLTIPLFGFVIVLIFIAMPTIKMENFLINLSFDFKASWFLPYGIWLFSLGGFATLPEVRDIFAKSSIKSFKKVIVVSMVLSAVFYFLFIFAVWGASNTNTTPDALSGITKVLGVKALMAGSLMGFLAVFTSFLAMAIDMKNIFKLDYSISKIPAWLLTVIPPAVFFLLGAQNFTKIVSLVGALGLGVGGFFIIMMSNSLRKKIKEGDPEKVLRPIDSKVIKSHGFIKVLVLSAVFVGAIYEIWNLFF